MKHLHRLEIRGFAVCIAGVFSLFLLMPLYKMHELMVFVPVGIVAIGGVLLLWGQQLRIKKWRHL